MANAESRAKTNAAKSAARLGVLNRFLGDGVTKQFRDPALNFGGGNKPANPVPDDADLGAGFFG